MDPISQMIMISIGNVVAWLAAIYVKDALPGLIGNLVISTTGAFVAGYLCLRFLPELDKLEHLDQLLALWEWRTGPTPWAYMTVSSPK